ncbi:hypothetical protein MMC10_010166 [Thelotrema lepadinum]|nr:hypothetical protein [Thelotrema lepadinum]
MTPRFPALTTKPQHHPDCCLSLSTPLITYLLSHIRSLNPKVLSIGSGSGLLETHLQAAANPSLNLIGVEVGTESPNKYLPLEATFHVKGTWEVCPEARQAGAWLFVYPRDPRLVNRYLDEVMANRSGERLAIGFPGSIVWAGPRADWDIFEKCFVRDGLRRVALSTGAEAGLVEYEMCAVFDVSVEVTREGSVASSSQ